MGEASAIRFLTENYELKIYPPRTFKRSEMIIVKLYSPINGNVARHKSLIKSGGVWFNSHPEPTLFFALYFPPPHPVFNNKRIIQIVIVIKGEFFFVSVYLNK